MGADAPVGGMNVSDSQTPAAPVAGSRRRQWVAAASLIAAFTVLVGCAQTIAGTAGTAAGQGTTTSSSTSKSSSSTSRTSSTSASTTSSRSSESSTSSSSSSSSTETSTSTSFTGNPDNLPVTAPGTTLTFNDPATVPVTTILGADALLTFSKVTLTKGTTADWATLGVKPEDAKDNVPWYINLTITQVAGAKVSDDILDSDLWAYTPDGSFVMPSFFIDDNNSLCPRSLSPSDYTIGSSYPSCNVLAAGPNDVVDRVTFEGVFDGPYSADPVTWK